MFEVGGREDDRNRHENQRGREGERNPEAQRDREEQQPHEKLDERVAHRDTNRAATALSAEDEVRDDGDIVVSPDGGVALRAVRTGPCDRLFEGDAVDHDVQEAPDEQPEQARQDGGDHGDIPSVT